MAPAPTGSPFRYVHYVCRDSGIVMARLIENPIGEYFFRCWCPKGSFTRRNFPKWSQVPPKTFELIDMETA